MPIDVSTLDPSAAHTDEATEAEPTGPRAKPLVPGSVVAKALAAIWAGAPLTIVDAPPGSGKTASVVDIVAHLTENAGLRVLVEVVTRNQGVALAHRLVEQIAPAHVEVGIKNVAPGSLPAGLYSGLRGSTVKKSRVTVRTVASCGVSMPTGFDVVVVDEAYQATYAGVFLATVGVPQVVCVGDPGQIGPVITVDTSIWESMSEPPHRPAPEVLAAADCASRYSLETSWRLGPKSAAAIAPLYNFAFASGCVPRRLVGAGDANRGRTYGEIESITVPDTDAPDDLGVLGRVASRVDELLATRLYWPDPDDPGVEATRHTATRDIAVVVSRNSQVSIVSGMLAERGLDGVTVGTADRLQGAEFPIVVALDPALGSDGSSGHAMSNGRLCVMASRHTTHLSWIHDSLWTKALVGRSVTAVRGRAVRKALTSYAIGEM